MMRWFYSNAWSLRVRFSAFSARVPEWLLTSGSSRVWNCIYALQTCDPTHIPGLAGCVAVASVIAFITLNVRIAVLLACLQRSTQPQRKKSVRVLKLFVVCKIPCEADFEVSCAYSQIEIVQCAWRTTAHWGMSVPVHMGLSFALFFLGGLPFARLRAWRLAPLGGSSLRLALLAPLFSGVYG